MVKSSISFQKYPVPVEAVETAEKLSIDVFHCGIKDIAINNREAMKGYTSILMTFTVISFTKFSIAIRPRTNTSDKIALGGSGMCN